jgi:hypothetical protein
MPKNQVSDPITDHEITFARLLLNGTMTDRCAAEAAGLNPDTAAYTKTKPRVRAYMLELRAAAQERLVQQEIEEQRRLNQSREQVLARLWQIANLDPEMTRNSASAQIKALAMIVAIEGLISSGANGRRAVSAAKKSAPPLNGHIEPDAWLHQQQGKTIVPQPSPDPVHDEDSRGIPGPLPSVAADAPETTTSSPHAPVPASAPQIRVPSSMEKNLSGLRLRL